MDENSKQNDIVTEILDAAFDKDWDVFSPEEYKHQLAETQAVVKKLTPDEEKSKMNRRMNLRVRLLHITGKIGTKAGQHANGIFKPFAMSATTLQIPVICKRCQTLHLRIFARLRNIGSRTKHRAQFKPSFPFFAITVSLQAANTKCPKTKS